MIEATITERAIELEHDDIRFQGTLTLPETNQLLTAGNDTFQVPAAVLLLPDSGPLDRNHNSVQVQLNISNRIANHLADEGIASVRFDKRGCGLSKGDFDAAGHSDLVVDAQAWLDYLHESSAIAGSPIYVLGHGEGSLIAAQLSAANDFVRGQILLTPFVENFENIIRRQAENALREIAELGGFQGTIIRFFLKLSGNQLVKQQKLVKRIRKTRRDTFKIRKQVINAKWIREMVNLDAAVIHGKADLPTLLIGGQKDLQCLPEDVGKIALLLKGPVQHHIFSNLTHILRADSGKPSVQNYLKLSLQDVDERVLDTVSGWLHERIVDVDVKNVYPVRYSG